MAQESESRSLDKVVLRLPDGMRDRLKSAAEATNRSMNAEIVWRLERTFRYDDPAVSREIAHALDMGGILVADQAIHEMLEHFKCNIQDLPPHIQKLVQTTRYARNIVAHGLAPNEPPAKFVKSPLSQEPEGAN